MTSNDDQVPQSTSVVVKVHDIGGLNLPSGKVDGPEEDGLEEYYVELVLDEVIKKTEVAAKGDVVSWTDIIRFDGKMSSVLGLNVYSKNEIGSDHLIGSTEDTIESLLPEGLSGAFTRVLSGPSADENESQAGSTVEFSITIETQPSTLEDIGDGVITATATVEDSAAEDATAEDIADSWDPLLQRLQLFTEIVQGISEIHPFAKMAWSILSATHMIILNQPERDTNLDNLLCLITDAYAFVMDDEPVKTIESQNGIIGVMVRQTAECSYFIREYSTTLSFRQRVLDHMLSDTDNKIMKYENKFQELKAALQDEAVLETEITVLRILDIIGGQAEDVDLIDIPSTAGARFKPDKGCLPGTREQIIDEITQWVNCPNGEDVDRVCFLSGVTGCGKSAIAHTIAQRFDQLGRLGSSFCFDRADQFRGRPNYLFGTISLDIADLDPQWKSALCNVVREKFAVLSTLSPGEQFTKLILQPSEALTTAGPIVIVIDGLDESGDPATREVLLTIIRDSMPSLPSNFRVLVTSCPEPDIHEALAEKPRIRCQHMDSIDKGENETDISLYIQRELADVTDLELEWPEQEWCRLLLESSEGLFQWALTACSAIKRGSDAFSATERMKRFIAESARGLDGLYAEILSQAFDSSDSNCVDRFTSIMGRIMAAKEPLSVESLSKLDSDEEQADTVQLVLLPLGSLLTGVTETDIPVQPLHPSFRDFLTDEGRSGKFYVDSARQHQTLALASWRVMSAELQFNICKLETSYSKNCDVHDLENRIAQHISPHLSYACRFWEDHAREMTFESSAVQILKDFLHEYFLYWLEVLSLIGNLSSASLALESSHKWIKEHDEELSDFIRDAADFVSTFRDPMAQSAPHIYLSAVPFTPTKSIVSGHTSSIYPNVVSIDVGKLDNWPATERTLEGHTDVVISVAYAPDGRRIVSGSGDRTVRVWDAGTGDAVAGPFEGHSNAVSSVAYSPDGNRIASGSYDTTLRVWDAETGRVLTGPFEGHTGTVWSVAYSPDGKWIVSGSEDKTVRVWNEETGEAAAEPFEGHKKAVRSVAYSPDGARMASGSFDSTVRVWDAETGNIVTKPFKGHTDAVWAVAYSPDGLRIVSGSFDFTVRVWDAETGALVAGPFEGHRSGVFTVAFSPDGMHIVSGSFDKTLRVWDEETAEVIAGPFEGHTKAVRSVAYSPDGKSIVSGSSDQTVRVWGVATESFEGHTGTICSVAYSPDGTRIVSSSEDQTLRVWDAEIGKGIAGPFKEHTGSVLSVAYSPDSERIVSGSEDETVRMWDAQTGEVVARPFTDHTSVVLSVAYSPDGTRIVSGSEDLTLRVWDTETGEVVADPFEGHEMAVSSVAYSPDGTRIVSGSEDRTLRVWDAETGEVIAGPFEGHKEGVRSVAYSPDGDQIVSGSDDRTVRVWDAQIGEVVAGSFKGHRGSVLSVAYSPDGKRIVSGSEDLTLRVWDAETGEVIAGPFTGHTLPIESIAYSPDGKWIVSGSRDETVRVWDAELNTTPEDFATVVTSDDDGADLPKHINTGILHDGWLLGSKSELLLWIPPSHRIGLWTPWNRAVMGRRVTRLDFSHFVHGNAWEQCKAVE